MNQESEPKLSSRRRFLQKAGIVAGGLSAFALLLLGAPGAPQHTTEKPTDLAAQDPEIDSTHLNQIFEALRKSGDPFLTMIANQASFLHSTTVLPKEFPTWIHQSSVPLRIATTEKPFSSADTTLKFGEETFRVALNQNQVYQQLVLDYMKIDGITLSLPESVRQGGPLAEGLWLAKEYLQHMMNIRFALESYDTFHPNKAKITDKDGNPVTDREKQILYGVSFNLGQQSPGKSDLWFISDGFPTFVLGAIIEPLVIRKILPEKITAQWGFYRAAIMLQKIPPSIRQSIHDLINNWIISGTFLAPKNVTSVAYSDEIAPYIRTLQSEIYQNIPAIAQKIRKAT